MSRLTRSNFVALLSLLIVFTLGVAPTTARAEQRVALVIGNAAYAAGAIKTAANDAGLVAQTLESAGFEVMGARDLDQDAIRRAFRDFLDRAARLGSDDVVVVYLDGTASSSKVKTISSRWMHAWSAPPIYPCKPYGFRITRVRLRR